MTICQSVFAVQKAKNEIHSYGKRIKVIFAIIIFWLWLKIILFEFVGWRSYPFFSCCGWEHGVAEMLLAEFEEPLLD